MPRGVRFLGALVACVGLGSAATAQPAAEVRPQSALELLDLVRDGFRADRDEQRQREEAFLRNETAQPALLEVALADLTVEEARTQALEERFAEKDEEVRAVQKQLFERLGELGEVIASVRQVATDASGQLLDSLISSQLGPRADFLGRLGSSKDLPTTEEVERLWYELMREMTEQGRVVRFETPVLSTSGDRSARPVIRAGPFSALSNGEYLIWETLDQTLVEMTRQPPSRYVATVAPFERSTEGFHRLAVDPSRGSLLSALTDTPSLQERLQQGGYVGYVIISLGTFAVVLGLVRWAMMSVTGRRVAAQQLRDDAHSGNPLGRVLRVYEENRDADPETLELKLDEAVLRETAKLERFVWLVKTVSVVAPLLGLLGTVTGMIQTFQAITLFGAGDPKMMAGGISEALVTTMLGLTTAIPLVLLHATLAGSTRRIHDVLDEQSAGLIAQRAEQADA